MWALSWPICGLAMWRITGKLLTAAGGAACASQAGKAVRVLLVLPRRSGTALQLPAWLVEMFGFSRHIQVGEAPGNNFNAYQFSNVIMLVQGYAQARLARLCSHTSCVEAQRRSCACLACGDGWFLDTYLGARLQATSLGHR